MARDEASHLRVVDPETGELHDTCPVCEEWARKYHGALSQIGKLRADKDAEARAHKLWPQAVALWWEWKVATGRWQSKWSVRRFWLVEPYLRDRGFEMCRYAVWGVAAHPYTERITATYTEVHDGWETCFGDDGKVERYARRGYALFGKEFPVEAVS